MSNSKWLLSAGLALLLPGQAALAQERLQATFTGNQRAPSQAEIRLALTWIEARALGRDYAQRGLHDELLEFDAGGKRHWALVGFPASQRAGSLQPGARAELLLERVAGQPLALLLGAPSARPIRAVPTGLRSGRVRFAYAGREYSAATMDSNLVPSAFIAYPDAGVSELSLAYGDITNISAKLRLKGLAKPGEYIDYRDFDGTLTLQSSTYVRLTRAELRNCRLVLVRLSADGAEGRLRCVRAEGAAELVPTEVEFSARP